MAVPYSLLSPVPSHLIMIVALNLETAREYISELRPVPMPPPRRASLVVEVAPSEKVPEYQLGKVHSLR